MTKPKTTAPRIRQVNTSDLIPNPRNAKKHDEMQIAKIAGSIKEFGFGAPIITDGENGILAGHGRWMAAMKLGLEKVPCIEMNHLTPTQRRAYMLADNRLAEIGGGWDEEMLKLELEELGELDVDLDALGFGEDFLPPEPDFQPGTEEDQGKLDELAPKNVKCPHCNATFDSRGHEQS